MTKYLAIAFLITGFLVGDAYGKERKLPAWDDEKAKSLGMPLVPVGTVIICESEDIVGFRWENGTYHKVTFNKQKHVFKKVEPSEGCFMLWRPNPDSDNLLTDNSGFRPACFRYHPLGKESPPSGDTCSESYKKREGGNWEITISCDGGSTLFTPEITFSPNGLYHLSSMSHDVSTKPEKDQKSSLGIEWGKCTTISP